MKINSWQDWQRFKKGKKDFAKKWKICLNLQWVIRKQIRKHCCILSGTWLTTFRLKNFSSKDFLSKKWKPVTTAEAPHAFWVWWSMTPFFSAMSQCAKITWKVSFDNLSKASNIYKKMCFGTKKLRFEHFLKTAKSKLLLKASFLQFTK